MRQTIVRARLAAALLGAGLLLPATATAQIPDTFTNLQYFPEDISRDSLVGIMRQFSFALGVPCRHCHTGGPEDQPFSLQGVDFASDEKIEKRRARYMLRMVERINAELLPDLPHGDSPETGGHVRVECRTCHRGLPRPRMIDHIIEQKVVEEGAAAAVVHYRELRDRYYGDWSYDFGEWVISDLGVELAGRGMIAEGIEILKMTAEHHPESTSVWLRLGDLHRRAGDRDDAIAAYRRVLELRPEHAGAQRRLEELGAGGER